MLDARIRVAADLARSTPMPDLPFSAYRRFDDDGDRLAYEELYFRRRAHVIALAAEALIDPAARLDALADALWSVCDEYTWALPAHEMHATRLARGMDQCLDLFAALTAQLLAETVRVCGDRLDPRVAARVRDQVDHRVLSLLADDETPLLWEDWPHNWAAVCGGCAGLAALALWEPGPRLTRVLDRCRAAQLTYLSGFGDDGGCAEGVGYWVFGFAYFVYFAEGLREFTGEDLLAHPKVPAIARFPGAVHLGGGLFPAFSDAEERPRVPAGLARRIAERLRARVPGEAVESAAADLPRDWGDLSRTLRWGTPDPTSAPEPGTTYLPDLAWLVDRGQGVAFAAKGGHNAEPHNHNDLGQFVLAARGEVLLADLGAGEYRKGYFDDATRYGFLHASSRAHSVPRVDGREQVAGNARAAQVRDCRPRDDGVDFTLDISGAYEVNGLAALRRGFNWRRSSGELLVLDEVEAERPMPLEEVFVSRLRPEIGADGAVWTGSAAQARLRLPDGGAASVETLRTTDHHGAPDTVHLLRLGFDLAEGRTRLSLRFTVGGLPVAG
ncbi:heparinase II/III family protein [Streptomyces sp. NBC_00063]|uniref:heparinase II/III domain-containing protein n=1 Tax=Streptomyces sp. NBC_00063 TaxID=2975638 RepID=UPI002251C435|nr:heparinase II/III family protein [Streptomyces sp. NBC_00063]MCX5440953.1 heparinase II/III-family protein [Streptomyces sp. NBC_00063]